MTDENGNSFTISIPKHKSYFKSFDRSWKPLPIRKKICNPEKYYTRPSSAMLHKYCLPGGERLSVKTLKLDFFLLSSINYMKHMELARFQRSRAIPLIDKYKIASTDLRRRMYVEKPIDDVIAITDTDDFFYKLVGGRQLRHNVPIYKSFKQFLNSHLRLRQEIGVNRDCSTNIENNAKKELEQYNTSLQRCAEQAKLFEQFISHDYARSMAYLQKWDEIQIKLNEKNIEMQNLANKMFTFTSKIVGYDYKFRIQQKYGRFLYYLSPPSWRLQHRDFARSTEIETMGFDLGTEDGDDPFGVVFERLKRQCSNKYVKPVIYFSEPHHVMDVFDGIEKQQLNHFAHVTHVTPYTRKLNEECKMLRTNIERDSAGLKSFIVEMQSYVDFLESKADDLERKFHKIIHGFFYDCVGSPEVLKLVINLQFCHERINGDSPINLDLYNLAKFLEHFYMIYVSRLEYASSDAVKLAVKQSIVAERNKWKKAHAATRELRAFAEMKHALDRATAPNVRVPSPSLKPRKKNLQPKKSTRSTSIVKKDTKSAKVELTEAERDYLIYFTEWNETEDPTKYLHLEQATLK